jgi:hypothetical protein
VIDFFFFLLFKFGSSYLACLLICYLLQVRLLTSQTLVAPSVNLHSNVSLYSLFPAPLVGKSACTCRLAPPQLLPVHTGLSVQYSPAVATGEKGRSKSDTVGHYRGTWSCI